MPRQPWINSESDLQQLITSALSQGQSVWYGTLNDPTLTTLVTNHAYMVTGITTDAGGQTLVSLRNPWGSVDGGRVDVVSLNAVYNQLLDLDLTTIT